jgi:hypothetical protein
VKSSDLLKRVEELLDQGDAVLGTGELAIGGRYHYVQPAPMTGFRTACLSFIQSVYGGDHPHFKQFTSTTSGDSRSHAEQGIAILKAIRSEISGGWLFTLKALVAAELFDDFLEMAEHLLDSGFKDPAAVMIGSVLEEHLRQLCLKASISVEEERKGRNFPRKADQLNADLAHAKVYLTHDQKQVTAWLGLRNNAAHGKYDTYTLEQVKLFLAGLRGFMIKPSL